LPSVAEETPVGAPQRPGKWRALGGVARCDGCVRKQLVACWINDEAIDKWAEGVAAGRTYTKAPPGIACEECRLRRSLCVLSKTEKMRAAIQPAAEGSKAAGKRRREEPAEADDDDETRSKKSRVTSPSPSREALPPLPAVPPGAPGWFVPLYAVATSLLREQGRTADALEKIAASMKIMEEPVKGIRRNVKSAAISLDEAVAYLQKQDGPYEGTDSEASSDELDAGEVVGEAPGLAEEERAARDAEDTDGASSARDGSGEDEDEEMGD
jgi:hypothetical protein